MEVKANVRGMDTTDAQKYRYYHSFQCIYRRDQFFQASVLVMVPFTNEERGSLWNAVKGSSQKSTSLEY